MGVSESMESVRRSSFKCAVDKMMETLTGRLHTVVDDLILKLYDCFTEAERQKINSCRTNIKKTEELFTTLKTKSVTAYDKCLLAMEDLNHGDLVSTLKEEWEKMSSPKWKPSMHPTLTSKLKFSVPITAASVTLPFDSKSLMHIFFGGQSVYM